MFNPLYLFTFLPTWLAGVFLLRLLKQRRDEERAEPAIVEARREE